MIQAKAAYISNKPPLVREHVFPLTGFVGLSAHATYGGSSGIMLTARPLLLYPCVSQAKTSRGESNVTVCSHGYNKFGLCIRDVLCVQCKLETLLFVMRAKVAYLSSKPPLVC